MAEPRVTRPLASVPFVVRRIAWEAFRSSRSLAGLVGAEQRMLWVPLFGTRKDARSRSPP